LDPPQPKKVKLKTEEDRCKELKRNLDERDARASARYLGLFSPVYQQFMAIEQGKWMNIGFQTTGCGGIYSTFRQSHLDILGLPWVYYMGYMNYDLS